MLIVALSQNTSYTNFEVKDKLYSVFIVMRQISIAVAFINVFNHKCWNSKDILVNFQFPKSHLIGFSHLIGQSNHFKTLQKN